MWSFQDFPSKHLEIIGIGVWGCFLSNCVGCGSVLGAWEGLLDAYGVGGVGYMLGEYGKRALRIFCVKQHICLRLKRSHSEA